MPKKKKKVKRKTNKKQVVKKKLFNRRANVKYPDLDPAYNLKTRVEEVKDLASYAHTLSDKDKAWLNKFSSEYIGASFGDKPLHKTKKLRKSVYDSNNSRNRDVYSRSKASGNLNSLEEIKNWNDD